ncbi:hypothetical protein NL108_017922, partial [Boleophthalmus pectinirostris]
SELQIGAVLEKTLVGLKDLQNFLEAVERLAASSLPVFMQQKKPVVDLPEQVYGLVLSSHVLAPLLLLFKNDNELFFKAKVPNQKIFQDQLNIYIQTASILESNLESWCCESGVLTTQLTVSVSFSVSRKDSQFRMLCLFQGRSFTFRQTLSELKPQMEQCLDELEKCAQKLDSMNKGACISGVVSSSAGIVGSILFITGLCVMPITFGTSLAAAGAVIGLTSGVQAIVTAVVEHEVNSTQNNKAKEAFEKCMALMNQMQQSVRDIIQQLFQGLTEDALREALVGTYNGGVLINNLYGARSVIKEYLYGVRREENAASDVSEGAVSVSRAVSKGLQVDREVSATLNGALAAVDVYFLSHDIKSLTHSTDTHVCLTFSPGSKWMRASSGLFHAEIQSWQNIQNLIGKNERLSDLKLLKKPFYPEV